MYRNDDGDVVGLVGRGAPETIMPNSIFVSKKILSLDIHKIESLFGSQVLSSFMTNN